MNCKINLQYSAGSKKYADYGALWRPDMEQQPPMSTQTLVIKGLVADTAGRRAVGRPEFLVQVWLNTWSQVSEWMLQPVGCRAGAGKILGSSSKYSMVFFHSKTAFHTLALHSLLLYSTLYTQSSLCPTWVRSENPQLARQVELSNHCLCLHFDSARRNTCNYRLTWELPASNPDLSWNSFPLSSLHYILSRADGGEKSTKEHFSNRSEFIS